MGCVCVGGVWVLTYCHGCNVLTIAKYNRGWWFVCECVCVAERVTDKLIDSKT